MTIGEVKNDIRALIAEYQGGEGDSGYNDGDHIYNMKIVEPGFLYRVINYIDKNYFTVQRATVKMSQFSSVQAIARFIMINRSPA